MNTRFDDSLPALAKVVADTLGPEILAKGAVLRDVDGRLTFFAPEELDGAKSSSLSDKLRTELGPYARNDRVLAGIDALGADRVLEDPTAVTVSVGNYKVRLVDRRLVGADWLRSPVAVAAPPPRFVFASLKGGVGRSTALAVTAADIARQGHRVLAIDLDMEAPGLGPMLLDRGTVPEFGFLDAMVESGLSELEEPFFADMIGPSVLGGGAGRIDVIPVLGRRSLENPADVLAKIARAYTEKIGPGGGMATILDQIRALIDTFAGLDNYDVILVDARAGLHETAAAAIQGLGAEVFLFGLDEPQTFQGFQVLLAHLARFLRSEPIAPEWLTRLTLVQGKAPTDADRRRAFAEHCQRLFTKAGFAPRVSQQDGDANHVSGFGDIPWDDDSPDDEVLPDENWRMRTPLAVLEDSRFRGFRPLLQGDLMVDEVYHSSFGTLLDQVRAALQQGPEDIA